MKELNIEWKHLDEKGETCTRCSETGKTLKKVISDLTSEIKYKDIKVNFKETKLTEKDISQSNTILYNGVPIEKILSGVTVIENSCPSCSTIIGKSTCCRAVKHESEVYEDIPEELIRKATLKVLEM